MSRVAFAGTWIGCIAGGGPVRPSWPLLWPVVPAALLAHRLPALPSAGWTAALAVLGCAALVPHRPACRWLGVALLSIAFCLWRAAVALDARVDPAIEGIDLLVTGHVDSMPVAGSFGPVLRFRIGDCRLAEPRPAVDTPAAPCPAGARVVLRWSGGAAALMPEPGSRWALTIRLKRNHAVLNPGGYDAELAALAEGIAGRGYVRAGKAPAAGPSPLPGYETDIGIAFERARHWARGRLAEALAARDPEAAGTLVALVVGDQSAIPPRLWQVYQRTGVGHLMSISGLHITMLAAMALWACRRILCACARRFPAMFERWPAPLLAWWPALAMAFAYSLFSGWGIPAQRTCWMLAVAAWASATGRAGRIADVLALAAAVVVISDPWAPLSAGFWLSFAAVAAIVLHGGAAGARPGWWREAVGTQWAATVAMFPLGAVFFASVSLVGPLANAFAIPLVSAVVTPLALAGAAIASLSSAIGAILLWPVAVVTGLLIVALRLLSAAAGAIAVVASPGAAALVASIVAGYCVLAPTRPIARRQACVLMLPLLVGTDPRPPAGHWRLTAIDVGQGNAVLIETHRHRLLYDTGPSYGPGSDAGMRHVVPWLRRRGIADLDRLIVSHEDDDHAGGAGSVLDAMRVERISGALGRGHRLAADPRFTPCERGQRWQWDGVEFEMLHPGPDRIDARQAGGSRRVFGGNASSCVLRVRSPAGGALLAGDIGVAEERDLIRIYGDAGLAADVLLVPHHGSATSSSAAFLLAVTPRFAVAQVGYRNRFRHPNAAVVERYRRRGIELLRSDALATIRIGFAPGRPPELASWRQADRRYWRIRVEPDPDVTIPADGGDPTPPQKPVPIRPDRVPGGGPTGPSSRRRSKRPLRGSGPRRGCTGRPPWRRSARW
ncbi:MAG: DNA internalization-related competence protein ComEC/Rec2 [Pseudomonadota bacterium]|nr:DNA internalization-related competence protein ComEC/Rec2 [Pseudomonadota bacterium]